MRFSENYYSAMDSQYSSAMAGERFSNRMLGAPTSAMTPMQLQEFTMRGSSGLQNIEVGPVQAEKWQMIPKQHFEEMKRQAKLIGVKPSVHGPIIDPMGFREGKWGGESQRLQAEREFKDVIDKAYMLDPKGGIPVTLHINAGTPGEVWEKGLEVEDKETGKKKEVPRMMVVIDPESKEITGMEYEKREYPSGKVEIWDPHKKLNEANRSRWLQEKGKIAETIKNLHETQGAMADIEPRLVALYHAKATGVITPEERADLANLEMLGSGFDTRKKVLDSNLGSALQSIFDKAIKAQPKFKDEPAYKGFVKRHENIQKDMQRLSEKAAAMAEGRTRMVLGTKLRELQDKQLNLQKELLDKMPQPEFFVPINKWAKGEVAKTFSELAVHGYSKYKDGAPAISIENYTPDTALSKADDFREAILRSRKEAVKKLMSGRYKDKDKNKIRLSKSEAERVAKKLIGATWDVGHVNMWKKLGYDNEKVLEETKKIADLVKHIHLTDNFGFSDAHLVPGMGNVPIKEHLKILEKAGKLKDVRAIVEAGAYAAELKQDPTLPMLEYMGSPLYSWQASPGWDQVANNYFFGSGGYSAGYGNILPSNHFSLYGGGFSQLPISVGGVVPGQDKNSQFTGTPMS